MYSSQPHLTNNPFIPDAGATAAQRYPDISSAPQQQQQQLQSPMGNQFASQWGTSPGYDQQQQYTQGQQGYVQNYGYPQQQQQQQPIPTGSGFHPASSFGQQLAASVTPNISGSSYGYLSGAQAQGSQTAQSYQPAQQQLQSPGYSSVAAFDPYSSLGQLWSDQGQQQQQQQQQHQQQQSAYGGGQGASSYGQGGFGSSAPVTNTTAPTSGGYSSAGEPHPREYIRVNKASVEAWDPTAWKSLLGTFGALKRDWERRGAELKMRVSQTEGQLRQVQMQYAGGMYGYNNSQAEYLIQQAQTELSRLQGVRLFFT